MPASSVAGRGPAHFTLALSLCAMLLSVGPAHAQEREILAESAVTTEHVVTIGGQRVPYTATAGPSRSGTRRPADRLRLLRLL